MDIARKNSEVIHYLCLTKYLHTICFRGSQLKMALVKKHHKSRPVFETWFTLNTASKLKHFYTSKMWNKLITAKPDWSGVKKRSLEMIYYPHRSVWLQGSNHSLCKHCLKSSNWAIASQCWKLLIQGGFSTASLLTRLQPQSLIHLGL